MDKTVIEQNFSRVALFYDQYAFVQRAIGKQLLRFFSPQSAERILDVGCGTGDFTLSIKECFPFSTIYACDLSSKMIEVAMQKAKGTDILFLVEDGEKLSYANFFDLITSNVCFQWFQDLTNSLKVLKNGLQRRGKLFFSLFGRKTFCELKNCLEDYYQESLLLSADEFLSKEDLQRILQVHFDNFLIQEESLQFHFPSLRDFLLTIKYTGTRGKGLSGKVLSKEGLKVVEDIYLKKYGKIVVTYQVFYCRGCLA